MTDLAAFAKPQTIAAWILLVLLVLVLAGFARQGRRARRTVRMGTARLRYAEGLSAGQLDRNREWTPGQPLYAECPYEEGTDDHFIWLEGYRDASHMIMPSLPISGLIS
ncbi:hypothetical protein [Lichenicoccus sp.]|uniref:hypothetical protein n=1 Tax=Lichenicoccus sp. TaxID=2781899 RepID=UPI003D0DEFD1